jgi:hypothetical protein
MGMWRLHLTAGVLVLVAGCTQTAAPPNGEEPLGPGRFAHSAIHRTIAPWDGLATQLFLSEKPLAEGKPTAPFVSVRIYQAPSALSNQRVRLEVKETRQGAAQWIPKEGQDGPLSWVEVAFDEVREGKPVKGKYEVTFPDGTQQRGRFEAIWWAAEGRGG